LLFPGKRFTFSFPVTGSAELTHFHLRKPLDISEPGPGTRHCKSQTGKLETVRLSRIQPVINALMRELTHMVFSLQRGFECTIGEHGMKARIEVYMTFPCP
jgi:hypothetical protein